MYKLFFLAAALPLRSSCSPAEKKPPAAGRQAAGNNQHFRKLPKLLVTGNFDGDQRPDTVYQHTFSGLTKRELDTGPDPLHHDWDAVVQWLTQQRAEVALTLNKPARDTLHLGAGQGLYCLLNLGDNNADGQDELAFVVDRADFSQLNGCQVVTYCQGSWKVLKQFTINEEAFDTASDSIPPSRGIAGFLVKQGSQWRYTDPIMRRQWRPATARSTPRRCALRSAVKRPRSIFASCLRASICNPWPRPPASAGAKSMSGQKAWGASPASATSSRPTSTASTPTRCS